MTTRKYNGERHILLGPLYLAWGTGGRVVAVRLSAKRWAYRARRASFR